MNGLQRKEEKMFAEAEKVSFCIRRFYFSVGKLYFIGKLGKLYFSQKTRKLYFIGGLEICTSFTSLESCTSFARLAIHKPEKL